MAAAGELRAEQCPGAERQRTLHERASIHRCDKPLQRGCFDAGLGKHGRLQPFTVDGDCREGGVELS